MSATKSYLEVKERPGFDEFSQHPHRWKLTAQPTGDWLCESRYGSVQSAVVVDAEGNPVFDRPVYREAPSLNVVAYGIADDGTARFAVISQPRPHADDPEQAPGTPNAPVVFGQIVMGFLETVMGKDLVAEYESVKDGSIRELKEEAGARVILDIERPALPWHNPNPTFVASWTDLVFVKVDLASLERHRSTREEPIFKAEFVTVQELQRRVREGRDADGAIYRMGTSNSAWFIFFCTHPELFREDGRNAPGSGF